jgi:hypothetical protein
MVDCLCAFGVRIERTSRRACESTADDITQRDELQHSMRPCDLICCVRTALH